MQTQIVELALEAPELSPRELAVRFTDETKYFVSESSVYRLLKARNLITSPAYIVMKAADEFKDKTTAPNQLLQTDFTYLKIIGWGWYYLSTILDDFSRFIVAWQLGPTMRTDDVTATVEQALAFAELERNAPRTKLQRSRWRAKKDRIGNSYPHAHRGAGPRRAGDPKRLKAPISSCRPRPGDRQFNTKSRRHGESRAKLRGRFSCF